MLLARNVADVQSSDINHKDKFRKSQRIILSLSILLSRMKTEPREDERNMLKDLFLMVYRASGGWKRG
jgi:hypothetical protein